MVQTKVLYEAIEEILDAIVTLVEAETVDGGSLSDIEEVIRGDRHKTKPAVPAIWIFAETANIAHPPMAMAEKWTMPVILSAIVKNDDVEEGYKEATELAAKARTAVLSDRTLGLRTFVQDTRSLRFEPSAPWLRQGSLFAANAVIEVIFTIFETGG
jgi:hypothetical protein